MFGVNESRRRACLFAAALLILSLTGGVALARGGLTWSPRGYNIFSNYAYASVWGALMGAGIPHHSLDAPGLNMGGPAGGGFRTSGGAGPQDPMLRTMLPTLPRNNAPIYRQPHREEYSLDPNRATIGQQVAGAYNPPYYHNYNSYWLRGYWGGGMWGWGRWGGSMGIWSFPRWWLGYLYYATGYGLLENPFLGKEDDQTPDYLDYAHPVQVDLDAPPAGLPGDAAIDGSRTQILRTPAQMAGLKLFDAAVAAFKERNYGQALDDINAALKQMPLDPALHQFRALVLFARGNYTQAAEAIYAVLAVSPGWNWTTQSGLYGSLDEYTRQLRALEAYNKEHLDAADARFLLAYQYITCGHFDAAVKQLQAVVKTLPHDELAPHLLTLVAGAIDEPAPSAVAAATDSAALRAQRSADASPIDTAKILGTWKAARVGAIQIELTLGGDQKFSWTVTQAGSRRQIEGAYSLDRELLLMAGSDGEPLIGFIILDKTGGFNFKFVGADPSDPGLDFSR